MNTLYVRFTITALFLVAGLQGGWCQSHSVLRMNLYPNAVPNSKSVPDEEVRTCNPEVDSLASGVSRPTLTLFFPDNQLKKRTAVIICPGGGYHTLLTTREGSKLAEAFNKIGVVGIVLKYRHPNEKFQPDPTIAPLQDAQRAIQVVRENAEKWGIDPLKIGIMGFSAGGHVAATAGTHYDMPVIENRNETSLRPDFMILIYPVISCRADITHEGSRNALIGANASEDKINCFSNEEQVSATTPPAFITHAGDDTVVPVENSLLFYNALRKHNIAAEMHIYATGEHGYLQEPSFDEWFNRCTRWLKKEVIKK